jgi:hypothetical protein
LLIAVASGVVEPAAAQVGAVKILSSRSGEKLKLELNPRPAGEVEVRVTLVDPNGNERQLPPRRRNCEPGSGVCFGPDMPVEASGSLVIVEVVDPRTGASLGVGAGWTG